MGLYEELGLEKGAGPDDIKKAYRKLILQFHPDKPTGDAEKFKKVQEAYEVLSDPDKRQHYDHWGSVEAAQQGPPNDIFAQMFGGGNPFGAAPRGPRRRADHEHTVTISLEQAYRGTSRNLRISLTKPCAQCRTKCTQCGGRGQIHHQMGPFAMAQPCGGCEGQGNKCSGCATCNFKKNIFENLNFELRIHKGVENGTVITAHGLGEQPHDPGEEAGNLHFHIQVEDHPLFMRQGKDLIYSTKISFEESVRGKVISVPHFDGSFDVDTRQWGPLDPRQDYIVPSKGMQEGGRLRMCFDVQYPGPGFTWKDVVGSQPSMHSAQES